MTRCILFALLLAAGPTPCLGAPISAVDGRGTRVTLQRPPVRIVSIAPSTTEILFALGLKAKIVGVTDFCDYPPAAKAVAKVGGYTTPIERVLALRPDLVVASGSGNRQVLQRLDAMRSPRIPTFAVDPNTMSEMYAAILAVGQVTGRAKQAETIVSGMRAAAADVTRRVSRAATRPKVLFVVQREPLWVVGPRNFMDEMVTQAGGVNVARASAPGYHAYSIELVIAAKPDVIISTHEPYASFERRAGWSATPAVRNRRVYTLGYEAARPGPRIVDAIRQIAVLLHPDLMK